MYYSLIMEILISVGRPSRIPRPQREKSIPASRAERPSKSAGFQSTSQYGLKQPSNFLKKQKSTSQQKPGMFDNLSLKTTKIHLYCSCSSFLYAIVMMSYCK